MQACYPLKFISVYQEKIWGGRKLSTLYNRQLPAGKIGESWDVSCHAHGLSVVANGVFAGRTLLELWEQYPQLFIGDVTKHRPKERFPLLIKIIDANDWLSVQVHPDDSYAAIHEPGDLGKTEMWYILATQPGGSIVYGLRRGVTAKQFAQAIEDGSVLDCLNTIPVAVGEVYPIPAGLVHALGQGVMVAEVQQNSDTVYRVYDWDRLDDQGEPRELHIRQALDVIDFSNQLDTKAQVDNPIVTNEYFIVNQLELAASSQDVDLAGTFQILVCLEGAINVGAGSSEICLDKGESCLIPGCCTSYSITGTASLLQVKLP